MPKPAIGKDRRIEITLQFLTLALGRKIEMENSTRYCVFYIIIGWFYQNIKDVIIPKFQVSSLRILSKTSRTFERVNFLFRRKKDEKI
jgi:hypothetical protein